MGQRVAESVEQLFLSVTIDDSIHQFCQLMKAVERRQGPEVFRKVSVRTARKAILTAARAASGEEDDEDRPWQQWPMNRPALDFALNKLTWAV